MKDFCEFFQIILSFLTIIIGAATIILIEGATCGGVTAHILNWEPMAHNFFGLLVYAKWCGIAFSIVCILLIIMTIIVNRQKAQSYTTKSKHNM